MVLQPRDSRLSLASCMLATGETTHRFAACRIEKQRTVELFASGVPLLTGRSHPGQQEVRCDVLQIDKQHLPCPSSRVVSIPAFVGQPGELRSQCLVLRIASGQFFEGPHGVIGIIEGERRDRESLPKPVGQWELCHSQSKQSPGLVQPPLVEGPLRHRRQQNGAGPPGIVRFRQQCVGALDFSGIVQLRG